MEKKEINLENPIFVFYVDVSNVSSQKGVEIMENYKRVFDIYSNITSWIIAADRTVVECIYDGVSKNRNSEISRFVKEINKRVDVLSSSKNFEDFKMNIRDWRINELIENEPPEE